VIYTAELFREIGSVTKRALSYLLHLLSEVYGEH
jgi:hypothetical protein